MSSTDVLFRCITTLQYICHHHQVTPSQWSSLTFSLNLAIHLFHPSSITPDRSSRLHPVSAQSRSMFVFDGRPTLVCPCVGVLKRKSSFLLQQCLACLVHLTWIACEMIGSWLYSCCFVRCCFQDLFKTARSILTA